MNGIDESASEWPSCSHSISSLIMNRRRVCYAIQTDFFLLVPRSLNNFIRRTNCSTLNTKCTQYVMKLSLIRTPESFRIVKESLHLAHWLQTYTCSVSNINILGFGHRRNVIQMWIVFVRTHPTQSLYDHVIVTLLWSLRSLGSSRWQSWIPLAKFGHAILSQFPGKHGLKDSIDDIQAAFIPVPIL